MKETNEEEITRLSAELGVVRADHNELWNNYLNHNYLNHNYLNHLRKFHGLTDEDDPRFMY